jgi:hypothetical protein
MYISPSPSARALHLQCDFGQFVSDFSCLFFGQPNNRMAISPQSCGCSGLSVPNHPALDSHSYKIAWQDCRAGHRSDVDSFAVEYIADHDRPSSREAPRSKGCACWRAIARQFARSRYFPFALSPSSTRHLTAHQRRGPPMTGTPCGSIIEGQWIRNATTTCSKTKPRQMRLSFALSLQASTSATMVSTSDENSSK